MSMGFGGYLSGEIEHEKMQLEEHVSADGHPVALERIESMRHDIDEIKTEQREIQAGVSELLRRVPPR